MAKVARSLVLVCIVLLAVHGAVGKAAGEAQWRIVQRGPSDLYQGIDARSEDDVWVAGGHRVRTRPHDYAFSPLLEGWDGTHWAKAPTPPIGPATQGWFWDVAASAENDVWAVGITWKTTLGFDVKNYKQLLAHFDGTSWRVFRPPAPGRFSKLEAITAIAPDDVWAIGVGAPQPFQYLSNQQLFAEHWNGVRWTTMKLPLTAAFIDANDVDAQAADDVWVVGDVSDDSNDVTPMSVHWDGRRWHVVEPPIREGCRQTLRGVAVLSASDVWAVGNSQSEDCNGPSVQVDHWNGTRWRLTRQPRPGANVLADVDGSSEHDIWAVGAADRGSLVEHWDGTTWKQVAGPSNVFNLNRARVLGRNGVWALGDLTPDISVVVRR